jgi:DNA-binding response OmpR family regulator
VLFADLDTAPLRARPLILLADDSLTIRTMVSSRLERSGYDVELATNGAEALELAGRLQPDLYILDVVMPGQTGLDVVRQLRVQGDTAPVILLTAQDDDGDVAAGRAAGADEYITKPFSPQDLYLLVRSLLPSAAGAEAAR